MELHISLQGAASAERTSELEDWLRQARLHGAEQIQQARRPPAIGEQGPELLALLTVVLAAPATVELVRSVHSWIEASRPGDVIVTIKGKKRTVTINARKPGSVAEVTAEAERLARE